jgi:hypothetical protein
MHSKVLSQANKYQAVENHSYNIKNSLIFYRLDRGN